MINKILNSTSIRTATLGSLIIKFLSAFFTFLSSVLLARTLGVKGFGVYVLAFSTVTILSIPVSMGLPLLITRYVSKYIVKNNNPAIKGLLIRSNQVVLTTSLIMGLLAFLLYHLWWNRYDVVIIETLSYSFFLIPLFSLGSLRAATLRGMQFVVLGQIPDTLMRNGLLCAGIFIFYILNFNMTPQYAMLVHIAAAAISFITGHVILKIKLLNQLKFIEPSFQTKEWIKQAIPFSINSGVQVVKSKLSTYILVVFGTIESVAIFDVAVKGANLVSFTLDAINTGVAPFISKYYEQNEMKLLQKTVTRATRVIFLFALPVVLVFVFGGDYILLFMFGADYTSAYIPIIILCLGQIVNAATGSVGLLLIMTGNQSYFAKVVGFVAVLNIILSIPMIIAYDVTGAVLVTSSLLIFQNIFLVIYAKNKLNINTAIF